MLHAVIARMVALAVLCPAVAGAQEAPRRISVDDATAMFAANSRALRAARAEARAFAAASSATGQAQNPTLATTRESIADGDRRAGETYVTLHQPFRWPWTAGARRAAIRGAAESGDARVRADSLEMAHAVRIAYVEAWMAERRQAVLERVAGVVRQAQARGAERFRAGDISGLDLGRLDLERIRYDRLVATGSLQVAAARRALGAAVLAPGDRTTVAPDGLPALQSSAPVDTVGGAAAHPLVQRAHAELALAVADVRAEATLVMPGPTLTAGFKRQDDGLSGLFVGASMPIPVVDRRSGARALAAARVAVAEARLQQVERQVMDDAGLARARHAVARRLADSVAAHSGRDLLAIASVAYEGGELDLTDLLATAAAWRELGTLADEHQAEYWLSRFELERALGGASPRAVPTPEDVR